MKQGSAPPRVPGESFPFPVLYSAQQLMVIDKPAGLPVHAGPRGGPSVEDAFAFLPVRKLGGPWLVHRLDADTSGCLVIALRKQALIAAQACFAEGRATKIYWAVVDGHPAQSSGVIDVALSRHSDATGWRMIADARGLAARTQWRVLGRDATRSWLELTLLSGRTHQARVHCALLGCPITGDWLYGRANEAGLQLMSRTICLPLDPLLDATASAPPHMVAALRNCGWTQQAR